MVRRYADTVEVRPAGATDDAPSTFLWRGRLYVVREVLGHWRERTAWWTAAAARAVHGEGGATEGLEGQEGPASPGHEREVWRVEASPGRSFGSGIYDLCRESSTSPSGVVNGAWCLLRVAD